MPRGVGISNWTSDWHRLGCRKSGPRSGGPEPLPRICRCRVGISISGGRCSSERRKDTPWKSRQRALSSDKLPETLSRFRLACPTGTPKNNREDAWRGFRYGPGRDPPAARCPEHRGLLLRLGRTVLRFLPRPPAPALTCEKEAPAPSVPLVAKIRPNDLQLARRLALHRVQARSCLMGGRPKDSASAARRGRGSGSRWCRCRARIRSAATGMATRAAPGSPAGSAPCPRRCRPGCTSNPRG